MNLYEILFEDFINNFISLKRQMYLEFPESWELVLESLYELPLNKWKSKLKPVPETLLYRNKDLILNIG